MWVASELLKRGHRSLALVRSEAKEGGAVRSEAKEGGEEAPMTQQPASATALLTPPLRQALASKGRRNFVACAAEAWRSVANLAQRAPLPDNAQCDPPSASPP